MGRTFGWLTICFIFPIAVWAQNSNPVYPSNGQYTTDTIVKFVWNPIQSTNVEYKLQITVDSTFQNVNIHKDSIYQNKYLMQLNAGETYWWRTGYSIKGGPTMWSASYKLIIFSPSTMPNIIGWFSSDSNITASTNKLQSWNSIIGNLIFQQNDTAKRPTYSDTNMFFAPSIYFDGINNFLQAPYLSSPANSLIIFHSPLNKNSTLASQAQFTYTGFNFYINNSQRPAINCLQTPSNTGFSFSGHPVPYPIPTNKVVVNAAMLSQSNISIYTNLSDTISNQTVSFLDSPISSYLRIGAMGNNSGYYKGNVFEILIADTILTKSNYQEIFNYLSWKYQPPVNLGPDIHISYGFCPISISTPIKYQSYHWSTGDTTAQIQVTKSGVYSLQVTDFFGRISTDSIKITSSVPPINLKDTIICANTTATLQGDILGDYKYSWDNNPLLNQPILTTGTPGSHILTVTDSFNCSVSDTANISLDLYANSVSLGGDVSVCSGEQLSLLSGAAQTTSYQWNTNIGDTFPQIVVTKSGKYSVTTTNNRGCPAVSQIYVTIKGPSPYASFTKSKLAVCAGDTLVLTDTSIPGDTLSPVTQWYYNFGNGHADTMQNPFVVYTLPGNYPISMKINTDSGCYSNFYDTITVLELPLPGITTGAKCSEQAVTINGFLSNGVLTNCLWTIDNGTSMPDTLTASNIYYTWNKAGKYKIHFLAFDHNGCKNSDSIMVDVHQSPGALFSLDPSVLCEGSIASVTDKSVGSTLYPNNTWKWDFGDGSPSTTGSSTSSHKYNTGGTYKVTLYTGSSITECYDSTTMIVKVGNAPVAIIVDSAFCSGQSKYIDEASFSIDDSLTGWKWSSPAFGLITDRKPFVVFQDTGYYPITLMVETTFGCRDTATVNAYVYPSPTAHFSIFPLYGTPPLNVQFINNSTNAMLFEWDLGDGFTSSTNNPVHTYKTAGIFEVALTATSDNGCIDTHFDKVYTEMTNFDIEVTSVQAILNDNKISVIANIKNNAPFPIHKIDLECWVNGKSPIVETWQANSVIDRLMPSHTLHYPFASKHIINQEELSEKYAVCVKISVPEYPNDNDPANDKKCTALKTTFHINPPYPNPAKDNIIIDAVFELKDNIAIEMLDLQGKKTTTLFNGTADKGLNTFVLSPPQNIAQGVYVIRITYRDYTDMHKVIISR